MCQEAPIVSNIVTSAVNSLFSKLAFLSAGCAKCYPELLPKVMDQWINKTNDFTDSSFDLEGILRNVSL